MITITQLKTASKKELADINHLLPQLSVEALPFSFGDLKNILSQKNLLFLTARDEGRIIGMGLLFLFRKSQGLSAAIENVVVDESYRGKGIGKLLTEKLIASAKKRKAEYIDLTSKPERTAANNLYKSLGFELRNTNAYRLNLKPKIKNPKLQQKTKNF